LVLVSGHEIKVVVAVLVLTKKFKSLGIYLLL